MKDDTALEDLSTSAAAPSAPGFWQQRGSQSLRRQPNVLARLYSLALQGHTDQALDVLFDLVDKTLAAGNYEACDRILTKIDLTKIDTDLIVGALSISYPARRRLLRRAQFVTRARTYLLGRLPRREVEALLHGLEQ